MKNLNMKIFAIKVIFICFCFSLTFHFTIGLFITKFKKSFYGTISYMPALFGLHGAAEVIRYLSAKE